MAYSTHIPTKGRLGSGMWQAVKGFFSVAISEEEASTATRPDTVVITITNRPATLTTLQRSVTLEVIN